VSVFVLVVVPLVFLLVFLRRGGFAGAAWFSVERADYSGWRGVRQVIERGVTDHEAGNRMEMFLSIEG
jgi:hypothetical protein